MKCYNHPQNDAVGICKNCNKGLCSDCAVDVGGGLACRNTCEEEVKYINELIERNKKISQNTAGVFARSTWLSAILGLLFILFGAYNLIYEGSYFSPFAYFMIIAGIIFGIGAVFSYINRKKTA